MRSERQALADITKLCDERDTYAGLVMRVRAILADVEPEPAPAGGTIDRAMFVEAYESLPGSDGSPDSETVADLAERAVLPDDEMQRQIDQLLAERYRGGGTIDRDAVERVVLDLLNSEREDIAAVQIASARIVALVRPVEGVVLTREDAETAVNGLQWASMHHPDGAPHDWGLMFHALAKRLEATS